MSDKLMLTNQALNAAPDLKSVFELEAFKHNFANNYNITSGSTKGALIFEREKILFMKAKEANPELEKCTRFSLYAAFIELAASGSTLADGCAYIVPYGGKAGFQMGYKGRLEQMNTIPGIELIPEPQVVYTGDEFDYELGEKPRIIKHKPIKAADRPTGAVIEYVYLVVKHYETTHITLLDRNKVLSVRDNYSIQFKYWKSKGGEMDGDKISKKATAQGSNGPYDVKPPLWVTDPERCFKKTAVNQAYSFLPKTERMKALDRRIKYNLDPETGEVKEAKEIDYGITDGGTQDATHQVVEANEPEQKQIETNAPKVQPTPPAEKPKLDNLSESF